LRQSFAEVSVSGLESLQRRLEKGPLLLAPNHVAWWDVFVCVALDARLGGGGHALMDAANLARLPYFGWVGALPLDRAHPRAAYRDLARSRAVVQQPGEFLFVFPQGEQRPAHLPLAFQSGVGWLAERFGLPIVPIGLRYEFGEGPLPRIFVAIGEELPSLPSERVVGELERAVAAQLELIDVELMRRVERQRVLSASPEPGSAVGDTAESGPFSPLFTARKVRELPRGSAWLAQWTKGESR
jgi:1-acyl-sn-glycerol-3-phosphate acyltransferase